MCDDGKGVSSLSVVTTFVQSCFYVDNISACRYSRISRIKNDVIKNAIYVSDTRVYSKTDF
jgi:hypothetical protein